MSSPSRQPHDQIANFLRVVCAEAEAAQHFSQLRISHAQFKLNALEELENLGSASKMEVARAARDLSIAKAASLEAAEVQTLARQELSRLKAPVESDSSPNYATVLLNR